MGVQDWREDAPIRGLVICTLGRRIFSDTLIHLIRENGGGGNNSLFRWSFPQIQKIIMSPGSSANLFPSPAAAEGKEGRSEDPTEEPFDVWDLILSSPEMKKLLGAAQQSDLPQKLAGFVEGQEMETG